MRRYWLYKCNQAGGPAGYFGDWEADVFCTSAEKQWGGSYSTLAHEVWKRLDDDVAGGDVVVAYQTDLRAVIGFCVVTRMTGPAGRRNILLKPVERLTSPFAIHEHKRGTLLEGSHAVNGMVMLRELGRPEMETLLQLTGCPQRILEGSAISGGYRP
ncbi:hypothetical protein ACFPJ1_12975 [Kribbella qitaiheensis]|uniref:hypothetical protein n=1 Tax=Kribbella qitaiheensis TaxID=1544730 RepID=UPI0036101D7A